MISVLHFSDPHVQEPVLAMPMRELVGKRLVGAANLWARRGKYFREAPQKLEKLAAFRRERAIDLALCTGDHTALGSEGEHRSARAAVDIFRDAPQGFLTIPGNHDLYLPDVIADQRFERHFGDLIRTDRPDLAVDGVYPFVRLFGEDLAVIGVNSARPNPNPIASNGAVPEAQLEALPRVLSTFSDRVCIVMTHYAPLERNGEPDTPHHGLDNAEKLLAICARPRVMLVHGHIHHRYHHASTEDRPWIFCAGSATYRDREGFWIYEIGRGRARAIPGTYFEGRYQMLAEQAVDLAW